MITQVYETFCVTQIYIYLSAACRNRQELFAAAVKAEQIADDEELRSILQKDMDETAKEHARKLTARTADVAYRRDLAAPLYCHVLVDTSKLAASEYRSGMPVCSCQHIAVNLECSM